MLRFDDGIIVPDLPYVARVGVVILFAILVSLVEVVARGRSASRWQEYLALILGGCAGAVFGALIDLSTSSISPMYFTVGKGLDPGPALQLCAVGIGARAGFSAGVLVVGSMLVALGPTSKLPPTWRSRLSSACLSIAMGSVWAAAISGLIAWFAVGSISPDAAERLELVWWTHAGAYAGLGATAVFEVWRLKRDSSIARLPMP